MSAKSLSPVTQKMGFTPKRDPIPEKRARREELTGTVDIDNAGGSLYAQEDQCRINYKYVPQTEFERMTNQSNGFGDYTNSQLYILNESSFDEMYSDDDWDQDFSYDEETYDYYGTYSDEYIDMVKNGEIIDSEFSCDMPEDMGASFEGDNLTPKDPEITAETPEQTAEASETTPEQPATPEAKTAEPKGELTTAFETAANPEQEPAPEPAAVPANNPVPQAPALQT